MKSMLCARELGGPLDASVRLSLSGAFKKFGVLSMGLSDTVQIRGSVDFISIFLMWWGRLRYN